jgi:predicted nucleic-acid-binding protein
MIAFDTNILVRLMVEDDETQLRLARKLLHTAAEDNDSIFVSDVVVCELEWVLESAYDVPRDRILLAVQALVADPRFCFENDKHLATALSLYGRGKADLSDYLLGLRAEREGARTTFTFDRDLRGDARFTVVR